MGRCGLCGKDEAKLDIETCVACGKVVCSNCRGDEGRGYWSHRGKKGYACCDCLESGKAYEGGLGTSSVREAKAYLGSVLYPKIIYDLDARLAKVQSEMAPAIVDQISRRLLNSRSVGDHVRLDLLGGKAVEGLVTDLEKLLVRDIDDVLEKRIRQIRVEAKSLLDDGLRAGEGFVGSLSKAIAEQRTGVKIDVGEVATTIRQEANRLMVWVFASVTVLGASIIVGAALLSK